MEPCTAQQWSMSEIALVSQRLYPNPFTDVFVWAEIQGPGGQRWQIPAFYAGEQTWRLRLTPTQPGDWEIRVQATPRDPDLERTLLLSVVPASGPGFLRTCPGQAWGFCFADGTPVFLLGDTLYNLFGAAHAGLDVQPVLAHRQAQGYNLVRARLPVSPFHPPACLNRFASDDLWPWGGSPQCPQFDRFNLRYFQTVDRVMHLLHRLGLGVELILEAWMFEFPFNARDRFTAEHEELWITYLVARYDAFPCLYLWTVANEYVYYPSGVYREGETVCDRWAARLARLIRTWGPHGHPIAVHTMREPHPPYAERLARYPEIEVILFQHWGTTDAAYAWLAAGIEEAIARQCHGARQVCVLAEYGYESAPAWGTLPPGHRHLTAEHTRRGAWRGAFAGLCVFSGFDNTWGPALGVEPDCPGAGQLRHLRHYLTRRVPGAQLRPVTLPDLRGGRPELPGGTPRALATPDQRVVAIYLPAGGGLGLSSARLQGAVATWFDPRSGAEKPATAERRGEEGWFSPPDGDHSTADWVLTVERPGGGE